MNVVAALTKLRVRNLEDGQRRKAHHVKTRKGHHSYSLQGNLSPSVINVALFNAQAIHGPCKSDRGNSHCVTAALDSSPEKYLQGCDAYGRERPCPWMRFPTIPSSPMMNESMPVDGSRRALRRHAASGDFISTLTGRRRSRRRAEPLPVRTGGGLSSWPQSPIRISTRPNGRSSIRWRTASAASESGNTLAIVGWIAPSDR